MACAIFAFGSLGILFALIVTLVPDIQNNIDLLWASNYFLALESMDFFILARATGNMKMGLTQSPFV